MRVGVIAGEIEGRSTGVGRYLTGMLAGLTRWRHGIDWRLYLRGEPSDHELWSDPAFEPVFSSSRRHPVVWEQLVLPWRLRGDALDLLLGPAYTLPFGVSVPSVVVIHDLSFELLPEEFGRRERLRRRLLARRAARVAERVLVDSARVAAEVERLYGVERHRIGIVPVAIETGEPAPAAAAPGVRPPYLLVAGTVLERRVPRLLLEAFAAVAAERPRLELVFAGDNRLRDPARLGRWISELGLDARVRVLGFVDEPTLWALYRDAELSIYLSRYEGFGIPPLESLAAGTPALVGPGLALDELWPDYPLRVAELTAGAVAAALRRALSEPAEAREAVRRAAPVLAGLAPEACSRRLVDELRRAVAS